MRRPPISPDWWFKGHCSPLLTRGKGWSVYNHDPTAPPVYKLSKNVGVYIPGDPLTLSDLCFFGDNFLGHQGTFFTCATPDYDLGFGDAMIFELFPLQSDAADLAIRLANPGVGSLHYKFVICPSIGESGGEPTVTGAVAATELKSGILHTFATSWDASYVKIWINGLQTASGTIALPDGTLPGGGTYWYGDFGPAPPMIALGGEQANLAPFLWGTFSDAMIWKRAIHDPMFHLNMAHRFGAGR